MRFQEIVEGLREGDAFGRREWPKGTFIVAQIPQTIPANVVERMTSLPNAAKALLKNAGDGQIGYHDQVLIIRTTAGETNAATTYIPSWEDIFAEDWAYIVPPKQSAD